MSLSIKITFSDSEPKTPSGYGKDYAGGNENMITSRELLEDNENSQDYIVGGVKGPLRNSFPD